MKQESTNLRIKHLLCEESISLETFLQNQLALTIEQILELLDFGAIYINFKRCSQNQELKAHDYIRVHLFPRRFPTHTFSLEKVVIGENDDLLIIHKPPGLPVHPTLDNQKENLVHLLQLSLDKKLYVTQRLDIATQGLMVLAKNKPAQKEFNELLANKKVHKNYYVLVFPQLNCGDVTHYMCPHPRAPKIVSASPQEGWLHCQLVINQVKPFSLSKVKAHLLDLTLLTGRTHQIRTQLSFLGAPIIGDTMYGSHLTPSSFLGEWIALQSYQLSFIWKGEEHIHNLPVAADFSQITI